MSDVSYEIEIRFCVEQPKEAFAMLPFLEEGLGDTKHWETDIVGRGIYESGRLLRIGSVPSDGQARHFLGYKGSDEGEFANIRYELGEDITNGAMNSKILAEIGIQGSYTTPAELSAALNEAGHHPFMRFSGADRLGFYEPLALHTKVCHCADILGERTLIELELSANSLEEARIAESKLMALAAEYNLTKQLFREEPPTMLYQVMFPD